MNTSGNTVLITGGSAGIGLALAQAFLIANNNVIICGRSEHTLAEVKQKHPLIHTIQCDVEQPDERKRLFDYVIATHPQINMLINNAGVERELDFTNPAIIESHVEKEILINLGAPMHLSALFGTHFLKNQRPSAIVNVSSGLAFVPLQVVPVYCATKAAIHSFSQSLRAQLRQTNVAVFELVVPLVKTGIHEGAASQQMAEKRGISAMEVANATMKGIARDKYELYIHDTKSLQVASRIAPSLIRKLLNKATSK